MVDIDGPVEISVVLLIVAAVIGVAFGLNTSNIASAAGQLIAVVIVAGIVAKLGQALLGGA